MPDRGRDVIVTPSGSNAVAIILGAVILAAALIFGIWFFTTQGDTDGGTTEITVQVDPGGE